VSRLCRRHRPRPHQGRCRRRHTSRFLRRMKAFRGDKHCRREYSCRPHCRPRRRPRRRPCPSHSWRRRPRCPPPCKRANRERNWCAPPYTPGRDHKRCPRRSSSKRRWSTPSPTRTDFRQTEPSSCRGRREHRYRRRCAPRGKARLEASRDRPACTPRRHRFPRRPHLGHRLQCLLPCRRFPQCHRRCLHPRRPPNRNRFRTPHPPWASDRANGNACQHRTGIPMDRYPKPNTRSLRHPLNDSRLRPTSRQTQSRKQQQSIQ
jgi:hypothetical protein